MVNILVYSHDYFGSSDFVWRETLAGGNVGKFGESSVIHQTITIQISTYN